MAVVFVDVFFMYNFLVNLILLITTKLLCFSKTRGVYIAAGAFAGSVYAVFAMVCGLKGALGYILNFLASCIIIAFAFKTKSVKVFLKTAAVFMGGAFLYGGAMMFLVYYLHTGIYFGGGIFYVDISVVTLVLTACAVYVLIYLSKRMIEKKLMQSGKVYDLKIEVCGKEIDVSALYDSANMLCEPISTSPVILIEESALKNENLNIKTYRAIPYKGAGGSGLLMAFLPKNLYINGKKVEKDVYIACYNQKISESGAYRAILHPFAMP